MLSLYRISSSNNDYLKMTFTIEELSPFEQNAIIELRSRMKSLVNSDMYENTLIFYRFLKARDFSVNDAETMLRNHLVWRKINQVDTIIEDFQYKEVFSKYVDPSVIGFDKEGSLVVYIAGGKLDTRDIMKCVKKNNYVKHFIKCAETYKAYMKKLDETTQENVQQVTFILDCDKLSFANASSKETVEFYLKLIALYQDNYPEHMKAVYLINAPAFYVILLAIVKTIMSNATLNKIQSFSRNDWMKKLREKIDADILPAFLGGTKTDPDGNPMCKSFINHGGTIPPELFLTDEERHFKDKSKTEKIIVGNGKKIEIPVDAEVLGSVIEWEFYCKSGISFGLFRESPGEDLEEVIPVIAYDTPDGTEENSYKVRSPGKYILVFDNSSSWISSKEVEYCIKLLLPES